MGKILVIDDDADVRSIFKQALTGAGHEVILAHEGKEGLRLLRDADPDLIITDIMMPEMDGLEVLMSIRKEHVDIPVIAISGGMRAMPVDFLHHAKLFGACRVFHKPVSLADLLDTVNELLETAARR